MLKSSEIHCWRCGSTLEQISLPLRRLEECPSCRTELHVCMMCVFFDPGVADSCREPVAAEVRDKKKANFCDYLRLNPDAYRPENQQGTDAVASQLDALFGDSNADAVHKDPLEDLEDLFKKPES